MKHQRLPVEVDPFRLVEQGRMLQGKLAVKDFPRLQDLLFHGENTADEISTEINLEASNAETAGLAEHDEAQVLVKLEFGRNESGLAVVNGVIKCELNMSCQRCLNAVKTPFESALSVAFVHSDTQAETLQEGYDTWLVEDDRLFLRDFIEDEILLALPAMIAHDLDDRKQREQCKPPQFQGELLNDEKSAKQDREKGKGKEQDAQQKENPFDVLKDLKLDN